MIITTIIDGEQYAFDASSPIDISIPLNFNGPQPNAYGAEPAAAEACVSGDLLGDTRRGGSCNFERYTFIPHCNGTHTECVGHITNERISVRDCLKDTFVHARLVSIEPVADSNGDLVITREMLEGSSSPDEEKAADRRVESATGLIVRTLPNDDTKLTRVYADIIPPYFTADAMQFIVECGFKHLLVDMPSIDRIYDAGKLMNHRIFWCVGEGKFETSEGSRTNATITEMIYVPNEFEDGEYLLNLQIAPFAADAAPSRPLLFRRA